MKPVNLYIDLDDTLLHTHQWMVELMYRANGYRHTGKGFITPENTNGNIVPLLDSAEFMRATPVNQPLVDVLKQLPDHVQINVCTHRGYHKKGIQYTEELLDSLKIDFIHSFEYLCAFKQPNKVDYLRSLGEDYILLDDNPKFNDSATLERTGEVMVYTQEWNRYLPIPEHLRVNCPTELITKLEQNPIYQKYL